MAGSNEKTLQSYAARLAAYVDGTAPDVSGAVKDWIDALLADLPPSARLFELGAAFGRDAAYIRRRGFRIECADAVPGFVETLRARGLKARLFNVLTDDLPEIYDLIFANAVLLHFTGDEFALALAKLRCALAAGGRLAFSLKRGRGEEWSNAKIGAPRYFLHWEAEDLPPFLRAAGFASWEIACARENWLYVTARAP
ncbi:class I SAM-dependent methyltransferase [Rhodoblastus acidophilus]|uniref:Class I SAM-dependent methyltransferase n=1 Tax=Candidatus Rhodoblastus alkanivorans TaxID=2954117 RepID=A0ABS9Z8B3_9HYPH|nr:methyltransferase domain-containing protein [Candidatus Rhodoblastus alkanivorans]MCI4679493.1 class I SAM-dependent methyltransferase [Candidatus Rhodoblastus alkanivorans]MCI4683938.1 class I SAM-dependent methyltransferase [Candidatus Rhodoblastus alkanivorans]MDI4641257.1 class I SAM-dependent methyltransferase [Rhodoblastus acidophilus]